MTTKVSPLENKDAVRIFPVIDRLFALFLILEILAFALFPILPLIVAAVAQSTQIRKSRWRRVSLWIFAAVLTLIVLTPLVLGHFDFNFVENGPTKNVGLG